MTIFVQSNEGRMPTRNATLTRRGTNPERGRAFPFFPSFAGGLWP
jgi:hypothetical protein